MARQTLLLDLDGTIWNSRPWYAEIIADLSDPHGSPARLEAELAQGKSVVKLAQESSVSKGRLEKAARERGSRLQLYKHVRRTLAELSERGTPMGLVTNLPRWLAVPLIEATDIKQYFGAIATPGAGVRAKPRPAGILKALKDMGREVDRHTWLVGDDYTDAEAALAAGVRFAWASYGYGATRPAADVELDQFAEVLEL